MKYILILIIAITSCISNEPIKNEETELKLLWGKNTLNADVPDAEPLVIEGTKIVYTGEIELVTIDIETGEELWRGMIDNKSALVSEKLLFDEQRKRILTNHKKDIKVWNSKTGESIFTLTAEDGVQSFPLGKHAILDDGYGIIGDTLDAYVLEPDGTIKFSVQFEFASAGLEFWDNKLYMTMGKTITGALTKGKILALNAQTGDSLWGYNTDKGGFTRVAPMIENGILYVGTIGNSSEDIFVALNAETGEVIWEFISDTYFTESFILGSQYIYASTGGSIFALNKSDGTLEWTFTWTSSTLVKPVYLEGYVYHSDHNRLFVIDGHTGELVHEEPLPENGGFFWHLAVSENKLFAQTSTQLIAYQPWHLKEKKD